MVSTSLSHYFPHCNEYHVERYLDSFFLLCLLLIGEKLLYNGVLVSAVQQWESVIIIHVFAPF